MSPWTERHRPKKFSEIRGQDPVVAQVEDFIKNFPSKKRAIVLHGPPGTGKTTIAHVAAGETDSEIFELNASDLRNKAKLREILKPALEQRSLIKTNKIILVDEVDGISAVDRGGLPELLSLIDQSPYPIIITANDIWDKKFSNLRKNAELVKVSEITYDTIQNVMEEILKKENLFLNRNLLKSIAFRSKGDMRAAINDLQTVSRMKDPSILNLDERNKEVDIFNALKLVFQGKPTDETLRIFDSVNMPLDKISLWIEKNITANYNPEETAKACEAMSKADLFKGRIYKKQYWRFLVYENIFLSYGISAAKKNLKPDFTSYKKPTRILKIWMNNQRIAKKKSIAMKYAELVHVGQKRALKEFPIIRQIISKNQEIQKELKLTNEEIDYLKLT